MLTFDDAQAVNRFKAPKCGCGHQRWFEAEDFDQQYQLGDAEGAVAPSTECKGACGGHFRRWKRGTSRPGPLRR